MISLVSRNKAWLRVSSCIRPWSSGCKQTLTIVSEFRESIFDGCDKSIGTSDVRTKDAMASDGRDLDTGWTVGDTEEKIERLFRSHGTTSKTEEIDAHHTFVPVPIQMRHMSSRDETHAFTSRSASRNAWRPHGMERWMHSHELAFHPGGRVRQNRTISGSAMTLDAGSGSSMGRFQFVNVPSEAAKDSIEGLSRSRGDIAMLQGVQGGYVVVDKGMHPDRVSVISGGGSGHEPFAAGLVGKGMLSAAVAGDVFASPSSTAIDAALRYCDQLQRSGHCDTKKLPGALVIVLNYMGDRLHFGLSISNAQASGMKVHQLVVAEDRALPLATRSNPPGPRGLAVAALVAKIAGASAARGDSLDEVTQFAKSFLDTSGTVGMASTACTLPGHANALRDVEGGCIEFGLGIHGEAGAVVARGLKDAKSAVDKALSVLMGDEGIHIAPGENTVLFVNGLGGLSHLELQLAAGETLKQLKSTKNITPIRCYVGNLVTSMDTSGVSITMARASEPLLELLDAPATPACWPFETCNDAVAEHEIHPDSPQKTLPLWTRFRPPATSASIEDTQEYTASDVKACDAIRLAIAGASAALIQEETLLNGLDAAAGDGDCGTTLADAARAVQKSLGILDHDGGLGGNATSHGIRLTDAKHPAALVKWMGELIHHAIGGTSGAIYYIGLLGAHKAIQRAHEKHAFGSTSNAYDASLIADALQEASEEIMRYSSAKLGDRTLLDALLGASVAAREASNAGRTVSSTLRSAHEGAQRSAEKTKDMIPRVGRSSYVSTRALGRPDAGAVAVSIWLKGASDATSRAFG